jgi:transposase
MVSLSLLMFPACPDLLIEDITLESKTVIISVRSTKTSVQCPACAHPSAKIHSRYVRVPADLPWMEYGVRLHLEVRRFFCQHEDCSRKTFAEPFPDLVQAHARRTTRQAQLLQEVAFALGGKAGAPLARRWGCAASRDTLLRLLRRCPLPASPVPRVLGLDDWAWRKGRRYGTILCDLERHVPVDLLPDRDADSVASWLKEHPGVEIISLDRAHDYAAGARRGAPHAILIADRFHLTKNFGDALEPLLDRHQDLFRFGEGVETAPALSPGKPLPPTEDLRPVPSKQAEQRRLAHREERLHRYEQVKALREQGLKIGAIAARLGVSRRTVERFLATGSFPERTRRRKEVTKLDPYRSHLARRWQQGCQNASHLWREITALGYNGSYASVRAYLTCMRTGSSLPLTPVPPPVRTLSSRQVRFLFQRSRADLQPQEQQDLQELLRRSAELAAIYQLAQRFRELIHQRGAERLDDWMQQAVGFPGPELRRFVNGLRQDYDAVRAALTYNWSNGIVEGHVNRLKLIKRSMYGRAQFDLLRLRVLYPTPPSKQEKGTSTAEPAANRGARQKAAHVQTSRAA